MAYALRSTRVLTADGLRAATLIVEGGKITAIRAWSDAGGAGQYDDFDDLLLLPGLVDSHVHINEPGRDWEGFDTATRAAAAGGVTTASRHALELRARNNHCRSPRSQAHSGAEKRLGRLGCLGWRGAGNAAELHLSPRPASRDSNAS